MVKNLPASTGDVGLIPGSGRSPGEGNGYPLQYSCLGNSMDRGACCVSLWGLKESDMAGKLSTRTEEALEMMLNYTPIQQV